MIFCTLCYGDYFAKKYSPDINKISENHSIYVYTNKPGYFKSSCNIIEYKRNGGDDNVKIIGYLDENNDPVYMSTLVL